MSLFDYLDLLKPKVTALNIFAGVTGLLLASNMETQWVTLGVFLAVGILAVGGCGAVNSFLDRDIDGVMPRTASRPLPSNLIKPPIRALYLGVGMIGGAAGIPMLPVILGNAKGARWAATASFALTPLPFLFYYTGLGGFVFLGFVLPLTGAVVYVNLRLYSATSEDWAWRSFKLSNLYLGALLIAILVDAATL